MAVLVASGCLATDPAIPESIVSAPEHPSAVLDEVLQCLRVVEVRDDVPPSWMCFGADEIAIDGAAGWDVWPHSGWRRKDSAEYVGWTTQLGDHRSLWLAVVDRVPRLVVQVSDGTGQISARVARPQRDNWISLQRKALPTIAAVQSATRACTVALPRTAEAATEPTAITLRQWYAVWHAAVERLDRTGAQIPAKCATVNTGGWGDRFEPPFPPLRP